MPAPGPGPGTTKTPKAGCCAFVRAFLSMFKRKKRARHSSSGRLTGPAIEDPVVEESSGPDQQSAQLDQAPELLVKKGEVECVEEEYEEEYEEEHEEVLDSQKAVETEKVAEEIDTELGVIRCVKEEQEVKEEVQEMQEEKQAVPVVAEQISEDSSLKVPDADESDLDDSDSEESSSEESPKPAPPVKNQRGKAQNNRAKKDAAPPFAAPELLLRPRGAVITFHSVVVNPPATLLMGSDKHENDHLLAQATDRLVFFHVDALPSAHVYLQLEPGQALRDVPHVLLNDAAQLCKANSAKGNRLGNVVVVYTLGSNLSKTRHMKAGEVGFVCDKEVRKILVSKRDDRIMDRLNNTKRKVLSHKSEREKQQRAKERQLQKTEAKLKKRKQKQEQQDSSDEESGDEKEQEETTLLETVTTRCFPSVEKRSVLQGCRVTVERHFDVRVQPPHKGEAEGRSTVTGAAEDVVYALAELKKLLFSEKQKAAAAPQDNKGGKGREVKGPCTKGSSKQKRKQ
ncbi:Coiled-coil domain-containing protein 25 [Chionoecetes opilio]|uniref:Coiled-coil domain-containing protein 25 n=1 Tax=Chionoecetes opilio TaxID=41210 RepID=A0A8J4YPY3_CHIOP|nr:Coiled-coil domain-containing protein 25 [Chionoecetes opilio]